MHIIIDQNQVEELKKKYTVLELDTFYVKSTGKNLTAWCVIENVPLLEIHQLESKSKLHANLMTEYRKRNWNYCIQAIEHLLGSWQGEIDSFYLDLSQRIAKYIEQDPGESWDGIIEKHTA